MLIAAGDCCYDDAFYQGGWEALVQHYYSVGLIRKGKVLNAALLYTPLFFKMVVFRRSEAKSSTLCHTQQRFVSELSLLD